ncbi:MAG: hypothetical protein WCT31_02770 [Candidatus Micrarchaeia archaeon]|jgi:hypothetical protein
MKNVSDKFATANLQIIRLTIQIKSMTDKNENGKNWKNREFG